MGWPTAALLQDSNENAQEESKEEPSQNSVINESSGGTSEMAGNSVTGDNVNNQEESKEEDM